MANHGSATAREETPHIIETRTIISDAIRRRAQSVINDTSIDPRWRIVIRYGLETNDPWLADLVRRTDAGERIIESTDFSPTLESNDDNSNEGKIEALTQMICCADERCAGALLVLMGTLEKSAHPKALANMAKHVAFTRCGELNLYGMVDAQIVALEDELLEHSTLVS